MRKILFTLGFLLGAVSVQAQQQFIGAGLTTTGTANTTRTGPYLEGSLKLGAPQFAGYKLGTVDAYAVLFPDPGARFSVALHPARFAKWEVRPFVGVGGQWLNLPRRDEWHSTLTLGAQLPKGFQVRLTRLHLNPQGYRAGFDYWKPIKGNLAFRFSADHTVNRRAGDYAVFSVGVARLYE